MTQELRLGEPAPFVCPECGGALWELADGGMLRYRCHVGHAFSADAMLAAETDEVEQLLERLLRLHRDRAALARRLAERERAQRRIDIADQLQARARDYQEDAELLQKLLRSPDDALRD